MPQAPLNAATAVNPAGKFVMNVVDATGNEYVASGKTGVNNIVGGAAAVVKGSAGRLVRISVTATITGNLTVNDAATTGTAAAANLVYSAVTPAAGTVIYLDWPCANGIVVSAGSSNTGIISVSYI